MRTISKNRKEANSRKQAKRRESYQDYLKSDHWKRIRERVLNRDGHECSVCLNRATQVHHLAYTRASMRGHTLRWMVSLCSTCHYRISTDFNGKRRSTEKANIRLCELLGLDYNQAMHEVEHAEYHGPKA